MAEPARQDPYDHETGGPVTRPDLRAIEGGGEKTPRQGNLHAVPSSADEEAAAEQGKPAHGLKLLQGGGESTPERGDLRSVSPSDLNGAEDAGGGFYRNSDDDKDKEKKKGKGISRRGKVGLGVGGGGIVGIIISFFFISNIYHVPSIMGGMSNDMHSSKIVRHILEKRLDRIITDYAIRKAAGNVSKFVKPDSSLDKLYKVFDSIDLLGRIEREAGIKFVKVGKSVHLEVNGEDVGKVENYDDYLKKREESAIVDEAATKVITKAAPVFRMSLSSTIFRWIKSFFRFPRFGAPPYDKTKSVADNVTALNEQSIDVVTKEGVSELASAEACTLENKCDDWNNMDSNKPINTADPADIRGVTPTQDVGDSSSQEVNKDLDQALSDSEEEVAKKGGSITEAIIEKLLAKIIGEAAAKTAAGALPAIGQIDLLSEIDHLIGVGFSDHVAALTGSYMREKAYGSLAALWLGYADQIKQGKMPLTFVTSLNKRLFGENKAQTRMFLSNGSTTGGVAVDPKVGSNLNDPLGDFQNSVYNGGVHIGAGLVIGPGPIIRSPLILWYRWVHPILNTFGAVGADVLGFLWNLTGISQALKASMIAIFGPDWQKQLALWAAKVIMNFFGLTIDSLAKGAMQFNNIYTGMDVTMNGYCRTNLGCESVSPKSDRFSIKQASDAYRKDVASLPLKDRLFSLNEGDSLLNTAIRNMPTTNNPVQFVGSLMGEVTKLPSALISAISGRSLADPTTADAALVDGVQQYGIKAGEEGKLDQPTTDALLNQDNITCPDNNDNNFNLCQADKETVSVGMCFNSACPQLDDGSGGTSLTYDSGQSKPTNIFKMMQQAFAAEIGSL